MDFCCGIKHLDYRKVAIFKTGKLILSSSRKTGSWFNFACIVNLRINEREFYRKYTEKCDFFCRKYNEKRAVHVGSILKSVLFM